MCSLVRSSSAATATCSSGGGVSTTSLDLLIRREWERRKEWASKQNEGKQDKERYPHGKKKHLREKEGQDVAPESPQRHPRREE